MNDMMWKGCFEQDVSKRPSTDQRYIVYSKLGILINARPGGAPVFSNAVQSRVELRDGDEIAAPTFLREEVEMLKQNPLFKMIEVELHGLAADPDLPGERVSMMACFKAWLLAEEAHEIAGSFPGWSELAPGVVPVLKS